MRLLVIGGSDAGISAGLRARELDPTVETTLVVADAMRGRLLQSALPS
jgi:protoporphyrinogen oxidase